MNKIKKARDKLLFLATGSIITLNSLFSRAFAEGSSAINGQQVTTITSKITNAVKDLAMPIGSVLIFISIVVTSIKLIINHNNPKSRVENISSVGWLVIAGLMLGCSLIIAAVIINVTSNNGQLWS